LSRIEERTQSIPHSPPGEFPSAKDYYVLHSILSANKERLLDDLRGRLEKYLPSDYYTMILFDPKGRQRTEEYFDIFLVALDGDLASFIKDQEMIGYKRAIEGYPLEGVLSFTLTFKSVIRDFINQYNLQTQNREQLISVDEVFYLHSILDYSYYSLSRFYLITRDEIIEKRRRQINDLHVFAGEVVSILNEEMLWEPLVKWAENLFQLKAQLVFESDDPDSLAGAGRTKSVGSLLEEHIAAELMARVRDSKLAMAVTPDKKLQPFEDQSDQRDFACICFPLPSRARQGKVNLLLHDQGKPFVFERFDQNLLSQLVYFSGSVLVNCGMVSELAEKREYLSNLTAILFDIQENERKRIAADIHDVITQALSGIGLKLILCQELMEKQPQRLEEELSRLVDNVNEALRHSRHIISNLRPAILDNLGIVTALKKTANDFAESTKVEIEFNAPQRIDLTPGADISIFRILQESLHNIRKHAGAGRVRISLKIRPHRILEMIVEDNGKGFDPGRRTRGLGLMLMRERAENLGGSFHLKSSLGNGTTVKVVLPLDGEKRNGAN
jgi:signal transduction histidine kinase